MSYPTNESFMGSHGNTKKRDCILSRNIQSGLYCDFPFIQSLILFLVKRHRKKLKVKVTKKTRRAMRQFIEY